MTTQIAATEKRSEQPRYVFEMPVRAEWGDPVNHIQWVRAEGHTTNIGPGGALVLLRPLPPVGSVVRLFITHAESPAIPYYEVETFVLRVDHDAGEPLAALMVPDWVAWTSRVYEPWVAAIEAALEAPSPTAKRTRTRTTTTPPTTGAVDAYAKSCRAANDNQKDASQRTWR